MSESDLPNTTARSTLAVAGNSMGIPLLVGESTSWKEAVRLAELAGSGKCATLIVGEVGTGKRSLAQHIHQIHCGGSHAFWVLRGGTDDERVLSRLLGGFGSDSLESQWDGSADVLESYDVGTLLIEDVDLLSTSAQSLLLEVLVLSLATHFDSTLAGRSWPMIIATSQQDLRQLVKECRFREDLFWRLSIFLIELAPLRRRVDDIKPLAEHLIKVFAELYAREGLTIERAAFKALKEYSWPGNIIELQNYLQRAIAGNEEDELTLSMFPATICGSTIESQQVSFRPTDPQSLIREFVNDHLGKSGDEVADLHKQIVEPVERELIQQVMELCNHTQTKAAARLGINRNTLYKKIVEYGLNKAIDKSDGGD